MKDNNRILVKGINCPICGKQLIDLQHDGYEGDYEDFHEYYCETCKITIEITAD